MNRVLRCRTGILVPVPKKEVASMLPPAEPLVLGKGKTPVLILPMSNLPVKATRQPLAVTVLLQIPPV